MATTTNNTNDSAEQYDCVYYWDGGLVAGQWRKATPTAAWLGGESTIDALVASIARGGRVAVRGHTSIGAPEGPPSRDRFVAVGFISR